MENILLPANLVQIDEELHNLYASSSIRVIRMINSRIMRWAGHVTGMHGREWWESQKEREKVVGQY
jgi:hypothetical protein